MKSKCESRASLVEGLRAEASAFDPPPPPGMRRRVLSAVAEAQGLGRAAGASGWWRVAMGATAVATAAGLAIFWRPAAVNSPTPQPTLVRATAPAPTFAIANPLTLAHRLVNDPLEAEYQDLVTRLSDAGRTVRNVLPGTSASKGTRPAGRAPGGGTTDEASAGA
jgi:hypothetical protein